MVFRIVYLVVNEVFVFGSNLAGRHGKGAALVAVKQYSAKYGVGICIQGMSYAIPTKDIRINTLPLSDIKPYVDSFIEFTKENPNLTFFVTSVGCGLAGYTPKQIAPMFKGAINCSFPESWKQYI